MFTARHYYVINHMILWMKLLVRPYNLGIIIINEFHKIMGEKEKKVIGLNNKNTSDRKHSLKIEWATSTPKELWNDAFDG